MPAAAIVHVPQHVGGGPESVTILEGGTILWQYGKAHHHSGIKAVQSADEMVKISIGSGTYEFVAH